MRSKRLSSLVGNNSGKTPFSEVIRRFLIDQDPKFQIEDFSNASYDGFCEAHKAKNVGKQDEDIRALIQSMAIPPADKDEVYKEIFEQAESFKNIRWLDSTCFSIETITPAHDLIKESGS